jgi:dCMP deaminase
MNTNNRISWDEYAIKIAQVASLRSEDPYKKVGACALDFSNRVIGVAYNGLAPGINVTPEFWANREERLPYMIHAEANLLSLLRRGECKTLACTLLPCSCCASMISAYGIKRVIYLEEYKRDMRALDIFNFNDIECIAFNSASKFFSEDTTQTLV